MQICRGSRFIKLQKQGAPQRPLLLCVPRPLHRNKLHLSALCSSACHRISTEAHLSPLRPLLLCVPPPLNKSIPFTSALCSSACHDLSTDAHFSILPLCVLPFLTPSQNPTKHHVEITVFCNFFTVFLLSSYSCIPLKFNGSNALKKMQCSHLFNFFLPIVLFVYVVYVYSIIFNNPFAVNEFPNHFF